MSDVNPGADGTPSSADGQQDKKDTVAFETYDKAMKALAKEKAKIKEFEEKLSVFESKQKAQEEAEMQKKGEFEKILEIKNKELSDLKQEIAQKKSQEVTSKKLTAFLSKLGGKLVDNDFLTFVEVDKIAINPDTNEVDDSTLMSEVSRFTSKYPTTIDFGKAGGLPSDRPNPPGSLTYEQWYKLPISEKKKRLKDVKK